MNVKFDFFGIAELKKSLDDLHAKLDILLSKPQYITPELEDAIRKVSLRSTSIDKKVTDL